MEGVLFMDYTNLSHVREKARERMKGFCGVYKVCDGDPSRLCQGIKYGEPIGMGGVGKGLSFTVNVASLDRIKLKTRIISPHMEPDMRTRIYGQDLSLPAMPSSVSGTKASMGGSVSELKFAEAVLRGAKDAGTLGWIGNTSDEGQELAGIRGLETVGTGVTIFKPQSNPRLLELIDMAEKAGAVAVGVDIDGVGSTNWERHGKPVYRKSVKDLSELADSTDLPFIVKGVMSIDDAEAAMDAGVQGVDVSNHGGRALDSTRGVAEVLPEISARINHRVTITAGGGVRTGFDVMKLLALGADGVLLGRPVIRAAIGGGAAGVKSHFDYIGSDLRRGMILTSTNSVKEVDRNILDSCSVCEK
jgi:4-hydroxymandelate oxidase